MMNEYTLNAYEQTEYTSDYEMYNEYLVDLVYYDIYGTVYDIALDAANRGKSCFDVAGIVNAAIEDSPIFDRAVKIVSKAYRQLEPSTTSIASALALFDANVNAVYDALDLTAEYAVYDALNAVTVC